MSRDEDNPYRSPAALPDGAACTAVSAGGLTCPYCGHKFPLTWKRYVLAPNGVHRCPACGNRGKLQMTVAYRFASSLTVVALLGGGAFVGYLLAHIWGKVVAWALAVVITFALDKHYDQRLGVLERTDEV